MKLAVCFELLPKFRSTSACIICILKRLKFTIDMAKIQQNMSKSLFLQNILSFVDNNETRPTFLVINEINRTEFFHQHLGG